MELPKPIDCRFDPRLDGTVPAALPDGWPLYRKAGDRGGYLIQAARPADQGWVLDEGHYLLVPNLHVARVGLVMGWSDTAWLLMFAIPEFVGVQPDDRPDHIRYELHGKSMGRTVPGHGHEHVYIGNAAQLAARFAAVVVPAKA